MKTAFTQTRFRIKPPTGSKTVLTHSSAEILKDCREAERPVHVLKRQTQQFSMKERRL